MWLTYGTRCGHALNKTVLTVGWKQEIKSRLNV